MTEWNRVAKALERIADALDRATTPIVTAEAERPWRDNRGHRPMFPPDALIDVKMRNGDILAPMFITDVDWSLNMSDCVTHWRPSK